MSRVCQNLRIVERTKGMIEAEGGRNSLEGKGWGRGDRRRRVGERYMHAWRDGAREERRG